LKVAVLAVVRAAVGMAEDVEVWADNPRGCLVEVVNKLRLTSLPREIHGGIIYLSVCKSRGV
jgi:hypothetical protein